MRKLGEALVAKLLFGASMVSVAMVVLIFLFVTKEGLPLFHSYSPASFFAGREWQPALPPPAGPQFGLLPSLWGSFLVTLGASLLAVPLGVACAIAIALVAPPRLRQALKGTVEMLTMVPSVALGFIGAVAVNPMVKGVFHLDSGKTAMAGAIMLALLALPTIVTIAEDALSAVPPAHHDASLALGPSRWQAISKVLVPAASPGIVAAIMLGIGRAVGETMAVIMVTGNALLLPDHGLWYAFSHSVRTITGTIGAEALEVANGEPHYHALFMLGLVLFAITLMLNLAAEAALRRQSRSLGR